MPPALSEPLTPIPKVLVRDIPALLSNMLAEETSFFRYNNQKNHRPPPGSPVFGDLLSANLAIEREKKISQDYNLVAGEDFVYLPLIGGSDGKAFMRNMSARPFSLTIGNVCVERIVSE